MDIAKLKEFGIPKIDIPQTIEAEKYVKCTVDGTHISKTTVRALLGEKEYWWKIHRAAFHWSAATEYDDHEYGFDCRDYFEA